MEDRILVLEVLKGNVAAFKELIGKYQRLVGHIVWRLVDDEMDREELCQDVFVKVYEKLSSFKFESKLSTWVATVAYRVALNHLKKNTNRRKMMVDLDQVNFVAPQVNEAEERDYSQFIQRLVRQMPETYRTILTLYHLEGFSYPEIVKVTGLPEGTVKNYLFRARKKLKELSAPYIGKEIEL